jgi:hypothetical protein
MLVDPLPTTEPWQNLVLPSKTILPCYLSDLPKSVDVDTLLPQRNDLKEYMLLQIQERMSKILIFIILIIIMIMITCNLLNV